MTYVAKIIIYGARDDVEPKDFPRDEYLKYIIFKDEKDAKNWLDAI